MVLVTGSWRVWLTGMAASLVIFAVVYFAVIQPNTNTANQAIKTGLQQSQQAINQAQKQLSSDTSAASSAAALPQQQSGNGASSASTVTGQAQQQLSDAAKLTTCVAAAGTDVTKVQACQAKYTP